MSQGQEEEQQVHPPLQCPDLVYRLARRRSDLDPITNDLSPVVFIRQSYDDVGLSVVIEDVVPLDEVRIDGRYANRCYGVATLHVGRVRDLELDVVPDTMDHANITGVPDAAEDPKKAESLSRRLARQARTVWRR